MSIDARLIFGGAAGQVTGSCSILEIKRGKQFSRHVIDLGIEQGGGNDYDQYFRKNSELPVDPKTVNSIILTHSHIDHIGKGPIAVRNGFEGRFFCIDATYELAEPMLLDAANLSDLWAKRTSRERKMKREFKEKKEKLIKRLRAGHKVTREERKEIDLRVFKKKLQEEKRRVRDLVLFTPEDVSNTLMLFKNFGYKYGQWIKLAKGVSLKFYPNPHILGSAICVIAIKESANDQRPKFICFTGDLGRKDNRILKSFLPIEEPIDEIIIEGLYGGIDHKDRREGEEKLAEQVREIHRTKGTLLVPVYVVQKSEELLYTLLAQMKAGIIPKTNVYIDSPLLKKTLDVYLDYSDSDVFGEGIHLISEGIKKGTVIFLESPLESDLVAESEEPKIVVAGSGTCEGGRIRNHFKKKLFLKNTIVAFAGYTIPNTLAYRLKNGAKFVKLNGERIEVKAKIVELDGFSGHADNKTLLEFIGSILKVNPKLRKIFINHGEPVRTEKLKESIAKEFGFSLRNIIIAKKGEAYQVA